MSDNAISCNLFFGPRGSQSTAHDAHGGLPPALFREQKTAKNSTYELSACQGSLRAELKQLIDGRIFLIPEDKRDSFRIREILKAKLGYSIDPSLSVIYGGGGESNRHSLADTHTRVVTQGLTPYRDHVFDGFEF